MDDLTNEQKASKLDEAKANLQLIKSKIERGQGEEGDALKFAKAEMDYSLLMASQKVQDVTDASYWNQRAFSSSMWYHNSKDRPDAEADLCKIKFERYKNVIEYIKVSSEPGAAQMAKSLEIRASGWNTLHKKVSPDKAPIVFREYPGSPPVAATNTAAPIK